MFFYKTALHIAVEQGNVEITEFLLKNKDIDVNAIYILNMKNLI